MKLPQILFLICCFFLYNLSCLGRLKMEEVLRCSVALAQPLQPPVGAFSRADIVFIAFIRRLRSAAAADCRHGAKSCDISGGAAGHPRCLRRKGRRHGCQGSSSDLFFKHSLFITVLFSMKALTPTSTGLFSHSDLPKD